MAVDSQRGKHHINIVSPQEIGLLMSAQSYRSEVTQAIRKIKQFPVWKPIQEISLNTISPGPHPVYRETGYPCIKTRNVLNMIAAQVPKDYADVSGIKELGKVQVKSGDLLINLTGAGSIGRVSIYFGDDKPITNQHIARITISDSVDAAYVCAFLRTWWGERTIEQGIAGSTGQLNMVNDHVRSIPIPIIKDDAQKYIGNKVRQAEMLRAWAKKLEKYVRQYHVALIPTQTTLRFGRKTRSVFASKMTDRLDAHFYPAVVEDYLKTSDVNFELLNQLCLSVFNGQSQPEVIEEVCEQITVANLSFSFVKGKSRWVEKPVSNDKYTGPHDLFMCNAAHNKSYIGKEITYNHSEKSLLPSTEVMVIRVNRDLVPASYIRSYLLTKLGYIQLQSTIRGITAHSYPTDVKQLDIPIPKVPKEKRGEWLACDDLMVTAGIATEVSGRLTNAAKQLVETLIENKLTEQELINAQKALDKGDNTLDRQILSRLTTKCIDAEGDPLFPDLDQLYELLNKAENSDGE